MWLLSILTSVVFAQAFDYNKAYQDYLYSYSLYQSAHSDYDISRSQYMSSKTIASQTKAQDTTVSMLGARDQAIVAYLAALKANLGNAVGVSDADKNALYTQIDTETAWYNTHKGKIGSAGSLDDLVSDSNESMNQFKQTGVVIYKTLTTISIGKTTDYRNRETTIIANLRSELSVIRTNGDKNVDSIDRALLDADDKLSRSVEKEQGAMTTISKMRPGDEKLSIFNNIELAVGESLSYIKEANGIVSDSVRQIKTID